MGQKIGVVIPTYNAEPYLRKCIESILLTDLNPEILVIDSSSTDNTVRIAQELGVRLMIIPKSEFNHGLTREKARKALNADIVVFMTPDAHAKDANLLKELTAPIIDGRAALSYARQIPHPGSSFFAAFPREFNYPAQSHIRGLHDREKYGAYLYFCSNSCAAYSTKALDNIGGFKSVVLGEDTVAAAELLRKGEKIAYVAEAVVYHSHEYSLKQEFRRYFDTGRARENYRALIGTHSMDQSRGKALVKAMMKRLLIKKPYLIPYAVLSCGVKWWGYKLGQISLRKRP